MFLLGMAVTTAGMFCLAATQNKQARLMFGRPPNSWPKRLLVTGGCFFLVVSLCIAAALYGWGVGIVTFFGWACVGGWLIALMLTLRR